MPTSKQQCDDNVAFVSEFLKKSTIDTGAILSVNTVSVPA
jgi:hypothetical protein